jgi:ferredoxin-type protein NapH
MIQKIGLGIFVLAFGLFTASLWMGDFELNTTALEESVGNEMQYKYIAKHAAALKGKRFDNNFAFIAALDGILMNANSDIIQDLAKQGIDRSSGGAYWDVILQPYKQKDIKYKTAKGSAVGLIKDNLTWMFLLTFGLAILGALIYFYPKLQRPAGIQNNGIMQSSLHSQGALGIAFGVYLVAFYIILYFFPFYMVNWIILVDPISIALSNSPASQWFLYGFLYTVAVAVMGIRMMIKYRHNNYQLVRTGSVIFFQTAFAFLIPQFLAAINQPAPDLKNIWPLDYGFFYKDNLNTLLDNGTLGYAMMIWGIILILIGVPLFTFFYGKRWYCSWVCGCGGLAETLGDPYRQQSDKRLKAWRIERFVINGVLVFAVLMTGLFLHQHFTGSYQIAGFSADNVKTTYGFLVSSIFAGVIGTGFYPLMGNRVWCRFGCPLAAYFGIIQKMRSRFRITTNGAQCISCGNCSTYCEMGIDVRAYAQRGQDIVRSSCVGCGVCAAVCPRGVLRLENAAEDVNTRTKELRALHIDRNGITLIN